MAKFIADDNTFGPYNDGRSYSTGIVVEGYIMDLRNPLDSGFMYKTRIVGRWAKAECLNGQVKRLEDWNVSPPLGIFECPLVEKVRHYA